MSFEVNRRLAARRPPLETSAQVDPVTAGIIRGAFETICYEVATHLGRSASSAIINQSNERNASIMDGQGRLAGLSVGIPQLLFISPMSVRHGIESREVDDWGPGDVFVGNDPDAGGGHLPDYNVYAPVYDAEGEIVAIQALQAHQGDTGGKDPGTFQQVRDFLWLVLVQQDVRQSETTNFLELFTTTHGKQFAKLIGRVLIAIFVHVKSCHRELGLGCISRICVINGQFIGN